MSLNKIIAETIDENENDGIINRQAAITSAVPKVLDDPEMTEMCVRGHISRLIASSAKRRSRDVANADSRQSSIFGLHDTHVVTEDGEGDIKRTSALTRIEFASLINVRQQQVNADLAYLARLRDASNKTGAIWDRHPDWTWGQVEAAYATMQRRAA